MLWGPLPPSFCIALALLSLCLSLYLLGCFLHWLFITSACHCPDFLVTLTQKNYCPAACVVSPPAPSPSRAGCVFFAFATLKWQLTLAFNRTDLLFYGQLPLPSSLSLSFLVSLPVCLSLSVAWPSNCGPSVCTFIWRQAVIVVCITTEASWASGFAVSWPERGLHWQRSAAPSLSLSIPLALPLSAAKCEAKTAKSP